VTVGGLCQGPGRRAALAAQSDIAREIEAARGGVVVPAEDPAALAAEIFNLKHACRRSEQLDQAGKQYATGELTPSRILARYEQFLDRCVAAAS
jgi:glycosyltransferase involved in cell wall biosynthesis